MTFLLRIAVVLAALTSPIARAVEVKWTVVQKAYDYLPTDTRDKLLGVILDAPTKWCTDKVIANTGNFSPLTCSDQYYQGYWLRVDFTYATTGNFRFWLGADIGGGGAMFFDGVKVNDRQGDHWWGGSDYNPTFVATLPVTPGAHLLEFFVFENCCLGNWSLRFDTGDGQLRPFGNDDDGDLIPDNVDNCPGFAWSGTADQDYDGLGNGCDPDDDGDGVSDEAELILGTDPLGTDRDGDGVKDYDDLDDDGDGIPDWIECRVPLATVANGGFEQPVGAGLHPEADVPDWETSAASGLITFGAFVSPVAPASYVEGKQYAVLDDSGSEQLYVDVPTTPGTQYYYRVRHSTAALPATLSLTAGPPGGTLVEVAQHTPSIVTWANFSGFYTVPAGQTVTRFALANVTPGAVHYLDAFSLLGACSLDSDADGMLDMNDYDSDDDNLDDRDEAGHGKDLYELTDPCWECLVPCESDCAKANVCNQDPACEASCANTCVETCAGACNAKPECATCTASCHTECERNAECYGDPNCTANCNYDCDYNCNLVCAPLSPTCAFTCADPCIATCDADFGCKGDPTCLAANGCYLNCQYECDRVCYDGSTGTSVNGLHDVVETSVDSGVLDYTVRNSDVDTDEDFRDIDSDGDDVLDGDDNCVVHANPLQEDADQDGFGDACDDDKDNDGVTDASDVCPDAPEDPDGVLDGDGCPDACNGGVVAQYRFETLPPRDSAGQNHGYSDGVSLAHGVSGHAVALDASEDRIVVSPVNRALNLTEELSIELWVKPTEWIDGEAPGLVVLEYYGDLQYFVRLTPDHHVAFSWNAWWSGEGDNVSDLVCDVGVWCHIVATVSMTDETIALYANGVSWTTPFMAGPLPSLNRATLKLGYNPMESSVLHGLIDEVTLYSRPLAAAAVTAHFLGGPPGKVVCDVDLDQNGVPDIVDHPVVDTDGDHVSDADEGLLGTDPADADRDDDGVPDFFDLDDDGDGLLDAVECGSAGLASANGSFEQPAVSGGSSLVPEAQVPGWETTATDGLLELWTDGNLNVSSAEGPQFAELNATQIASLYQDVATTPGATYLYTFYHRGRAGDDTVTLEAGAPGQPASVRTLTEVTSDPGAWTRVVGVYSVPAGQTTTRFAFTAVSAAGGRQQGNFLDGITFAPGCKADGDEDGIANFYDTDSDQDGVPDAVEAGHGRTSGNTASGPVGKNGLAADVETGADTGIPTYTPVDTDSDGKPDFLDTDSDGDGVLDGIDNCRLVKNPLQTDTNEDGRGDACPQCAGEGSACAAGVGVCRRSGVVVCNGATPACAAEPAPPGEESCNSLDDDCDGETDEGLTGTTCSAGVGACATTATTVCTGGAWVCPAVAAAPGTESCNGVDDDCDSATDEALSGTPCSSGTGACAATATTTCTSGAWVCPAVMGTPGVESCNGIDDDCDGDTDEGLTGTTCSAGKGACAADGTTVCTGGAWVCPAEPGGPGVETCNGIDDNCDGTTDEDLTGTPCTAGEGACAKSATTTCTDGEWVCPAVAGQPGVETCNAVDDDCDGSTDEALPAEPCTEGKGACSASGTATCTDGAWACSAKVGAPGLETCNAIDDDCDGDTDEALAGTPCAAGEGACATTATTVCTGGAWVCPAVAGEPGVESCNAVDDDCDGATDEDLTGTPCSAGEGACAASGTTTCTGGAWVCPAVAGEPGVESCNAVDDDCDGATDEDFGVGGACTVGVGACAKTGVFACSPAGGLACGVQAGEAEAEVCNAIDDDCDGAVDEADGTGDGATVAGATVCDLDGDGVNNASDNCPAQANADQADMDDNGTGDACESSAPPTDDGSGQGIRIRGSTLCSGGTSAGPSGPSLLLLLAVVGVLAAARRRRAGLLATAVLAPVLIATNADAQAIRFHQPLPGTDTNLVSVETARVPEAWRMTAGLYIDYANRPLVLYDEAAGTDTAIVEHQVQADALVGVAFPFGLELMVGMPVALYQSAESDPGPDGRSLPKAAAGDLRIHPKWQAYKDPTGFGVAVSMPVTVPTGDPDAYMGNDAVTIEPRVVLDGDLGRWVRLAGQVGYIIRTKAAETHAGTTGAAATTVALRVGNELRLALGLEARILPETLSFVGEAISKLPADGETSFSVDSAPLELGGALRWWPTRDHALTAGVGFAALPGYGAPLAHAYLGWTYQGHSPLDTDGDGLVDPSDACPTEPEDKDAFDDGDGCPDPDNDRDGIVDAKDACVNEPEDKDDFEDKDGCPDPDNDDDLVPDVTDKCPSVAEDKDAFEDEDGCVDPDNDQDGLLDADDKCPSEPETQNGFVDDDGCPDSKAALTKGEIKVQPVHFATGSAKLLPDALPILDDVVAIMKDHADIALVEIQGHTDDTNTDSANLKLSARRAKSVMTYLVDHGIARERLEPKGYGESEPIVRDITPEARAQNRRVVFKILKHDLEPK